MENDIGQVRRGSYEWSSFTRQSGEKYRHALLTGDIRSLEDHNVMRGIDQEIDFAREIGRACFGRSPAGRALDVCCGAGFFAAGLQRAGYEVTGVDLDENAIRIGGGLFPGIRFLHGDATKPLPKDLAAPFDLIIFREAHPFTRVGDAGLHEGLLHDYASILSPGGMIVIAHARRGGSMHYPSVDFGNLSAYARKRGFRTAGPYFHLLYKRLGLRRGSAAVFQMLTWGASAIQLVVGARFIEFFLLALSDDSSTS